MSPGDFLAQHRLLSAHGSSGFNVCTGESIEMITDPKMFIFSKERPEKNKSQKEKMKLYFVFILTNTLKLKPM